MTLPKAFGADWESFVRAWCLGTTPEYSPEVVAQALNTLERLWATKLASTTAENARGVVTVIPLIDWGLLLATCEHLPGFTDVFARARSGERGAYSELVLGAAIDATLGFPSRFGVPHGGRILDLGAWVDEAEVLFEVATPEVSESAEEQGRIIGILNDSLKGTGGAVHIEVEILNVITQDKAIGLASFARSVEPAAGWWEYKGVARVRKLPLGRSRPPLFDQPDRVQIRTAAEDNPSPDTSAVVVRYSAEDSRPKRLLAHEYQHLSDDVPNVLVFNTCALGGDGLTTWADRMASALQPKQYRSVGALAFFTQGIGSGRIVRRWRVVRNPHALHVPPSSLLQGIETLNES